MEDDGYAPYLFHIRNTPFLERLEHDFAQMTVLARSLNLEDVVMGLIRQRWGILIVFVSGCLSLLALLNAGDEETTKINSLASHAQGHFP
jgi:hypothetical protein